MGKAKKVVPVETSSGLTVLLTPKEVSVILQVSVQCLNQWRSARKGPPFVKVCGKVRYKTEELQKWIDGQTVETDLKLV